MKVGLVCPYSFDVPGGVQNHVLDLARVLLSRGHEVEVLAPGENSAALPDYVTTVGKAMPVRYNGSVARVALGPRVAAKVRRWLKVGRFDLLHVHEPATPSVSLIALWSTDLPVVSTFHTANERSRAMSSVAAVLRPSLEKISARIAVSETARQTLVRHVGGEPVVIPNGVFVEQFADAQPKPEWQQPGPTIGFLGRGDEPRKGLDVLVRAMPQILTRHPSARLLVAGGGSGHPSELGRLTESDKARFLSSLAVYVAPQVEGESFGIVLLEAMASGAPVVASNLPAFFDVTRGGRYADLFDTGDVDAAAHTISRLLDDDARRETMRKAAQEGVRQFDWSRVVADIEAVYAAVLGSPMRAEA
jgi:phosphatidyl-myo-inositol alpha-mannosyltransferase